MSAAVEEPPVVTGHEEPPKSALCPFPPLVVAAILTLATLLFVLLVAPPVYRATDDSLMALLAQGVGATRTPEVHLKWMHVFTGFLLTSLYRAIPAAPWYGLLLLGVHCLALTALLYAVLRRGATWTRVALVVLYLALVQLIFLTRLTFTTTAFLAGHAAVFLLLSDIEQQEGRSRVRLGAAAGLIFLGCLIRWESVVLGLVLGAPVALLLLFQHRDRVPVRKYLLLGAAVLPCIVGLEAMNRAYYHQDPGWRDFYAYNTLRTRFADYKLVPLTPKTRRVVAEAGWTWNDLAMMRHNFFADPERFSQEKLEYISSRFPPYHHDMTPVKAVKSVLRVLTARGNILCILYLCVPLLLLNGRRGRQAFGVSGTLALLLMLALVTVAKLPDRVYLPMTAFLAALALYFSERELRFTPALPRAGLPVVLAALALLPAPYLLYKVVRLEYRNSRGVRVQEARLQGAMRELSADPQRLYVVWGNILPMAMLSPLRSHPEFRDFKFISISAATRTPTTLARLEEFGIRDIYRALVEREDVFLMAWPVMHPYIVKYMDEHYGMQVELREHFVRRPLTVYRLVKAEAK